MSAFYEAALPAAAIFLILAAAYRAAHKPRTRTPRPASCPSTGAGRGHGCRPCTVTGCPDEATVYVGAGYETWQFCMTHGLPYLLRQDIDITDRDFREVMDDARRITREASGGVA